MQVVADTLSGGALQLLGVVGELLVEYKLQRPCGGVFGGLLHMSGAPFVAPAMVEGKLTSARLLRADGSVVARGLTVGEGLDADVRVSGIEVRPGFIVQLDNIDLRHA